MHVFQVIGNFGQGGDGRVALNLASGLQQRGVRSTCVALRDVGLPANAISGIELLNLGVNDGLRSYIRGLRRLRQVIRRDQPELLHVHGPHSLIFTVLLCRGICRPPRLWFTWHNSEAVLTEIGLRRRLLLWAMGHCDRIFGASRSIAQRLRDATGLGQRISVFRNGVTEALAGDRPANDAPVVLWMARFVPAKDPQILLRAMAKLRDKGVKFRAIFAGDALPHLQWHMDETRQLVSRLGLGGVVSMPGWIQDTASLVCSADIGVQTSHTEGLSMTLLEQMMAGLAVVATDVGDTSAAIEHGESGMLIPPKDEQALYSALEAMLTDPALRQRLGAAARKKAMAEFSIRAMAQRAVEEYSSLYCPAAAGAGEPIAQL